MRRGFPVLSRPRLEDRAVDVLDARITLLVAPAGSGKTVLLDQWAERLTATTGVVRLSLDIEHNDPLRFQSALMAAAAPELPLLPPDTGQITPASVTAFVAAIQARRRPDRPLVFIFDRFEQIVDAIIPDTIMAAVRLVPEEVSVVFSARVSPNILFTEFRGRGEVLEFGFDELRLGGAELRRLGEEAGFSSAEIERTEHESLGWPVAVRHLLTRDMARLGEYIDEEVLAALSAQRRQLVEEAAVAETIPQPRAEAVFGIDREGNVDEFIELQGVRLPLIREQRDGFWRLPPVLRRRLLQSLASRDPARFAQLQEQERAQARLSPREQEVLGLLDTGLSAPAAARELGVSFHTIKAHIRSLYDKLGVSSRVLALQRARALGLLDDAEPIGGAGVAGGRGGKGGGG